MRVLWRYERFLFRRFWDAGKYGGAQELKGQLLVASTPFLLLLIIGDFVPQSDIIRTILSVVAGLVMLAWATLIGRVMLRVWGKR
ncbi:hypothetical protein ACKI1O_50215, partial [Streptomyces scabiei]